MWVQRIVLLCAGLLPSAMGTQWGSWVGRWVNVDPSDMELLILDIEPDGSIHRLIPAPQFSARYHLERGRLITRTGDGSVDSSLVLQGDTLLRNGTPALVRKSGMPGQMTGIAGTWRPLGAAGAGAMDSFMTFRSDSQIALEVGIPVTATIRGDTLQLASAQVPSASFTVRQSKDTLYVSAGNKQRRLVRRPWGCMGFSRFDASAVECRE